MPGEQYSISTVATKSLITVMQATPKEGRQNGKLIIEIGDASQIWRGRDGNEDMQRGERRRHRVMGELLIPQYPH